MRIKALINKYKFPAFLIGVVSLAVVLVGISMRIYYVSGAFQLDLSRPEYEPVRSRIDQAAKKHNEFPTQGELTPQALDDFLSQYAPEADKVTSSNGFADDSLSNAQLGLDKGR